MDAENLLRSRGRRVTRQRLLIWCALTKEPGAHLSAEQLADRVQAEDADVHLATVYRTLETLVEDGLVHRTELGADRAYYEPAAEHLHHHIVCDHCGTITHIHDHDLGPLATRIKAATSYTLADRELTLHGTCANCTSP